MLQTSNRRNFLFLVTLLSIGSAIFSFQSCITRTTPSTTDTTKCGSCMGYNDITSIADSKLNMNLLKVMALKYQIPLGGNETNSVWFSLDKLKDFIHQIESNACTNCPEGKLGIRIYYGRYPTITTPGVLNNPFSDLDNLDASYTNIHTLFMIPTIDRGNYHYDFDPAASCKDYKSSLLAVDADSFGVYMSGGGGTITALMAMNHGDACPPPITGSSCSAIGAYFSK